jgi:tripartite ATP-independent transporter DctP family solute receptor
MNSISRRRFLKNSAIFSTVGPASFGVLTARAQTPQFTLKYASETVPSHPMTIRAREAIENIKRETQGQVDIRMYPQSVLGGGDDLLSQIRSGAIDFLHDDGLLFEQLVSGSSAYNVGFAFKNYDQIWAAMDGDLGKHLRDKLAKANLYTFERKWDNGFRQITSNDKVISSPGDLKGFKIRVPVGALLISLFKSLGAAPVTVSIKDAYMSLKTKLADGQENALPTIEAWKLYEVQKYCALTNHMWDGFWVCANGKSWARIPAPLQAIIERNFNEAALKERADIVTLNSALRGQLEQKGMTFNAVDNDAFRNVLSESGFYAEWRAKFGDETWSILEKYTGKLG